MVRDVEKYLMDTNSFVSPYRRYYAFDLVPSYWKVLSKRLGTGRIVVLDMVRDEIKKGDDPLTEWLDAQDGLSICPHVTPEIISKYQEILQYVQTCGFYKETALAEWAPEHIADPWIIAAAAVHDYTIITDEGPSGGLNKKNPNRYAKIPDVAEAFGVKSANLFYMMRQLKISI